MSDPLEELLLGGIKAALDESIDRVERRQDEKT